MQRLTYTSQLTSDDIRLFLLRYANLRDCIILENDLVAEKDRVIYFTCGDREYKMVCSDYSLRIVRIHDGVEGIKPVIRPSEDDWLCFLKGRFGKQYVKDYAEAFDAKDIIYTEARFISKLSYHSMLIMLRSILVDNNRSLKYDMANTEIIEVESFYRSERRFLISDRVNNRCFYMRISDFRIITPRLNSYSMYSILVGKFGNEYMEMFNKSISSYVDPDISPSFNEYCNYRKQSNAL